MQRRRTKSKLLTFYRLAPCLRSILTLSVLCCHLFLFFYEHNLMYAQDYWFEWNTHLIASVEAKCYLSIDNFCIWNLWWEQNAWGLNDFALKWNWIYNVHVPLSILLLDWQCGWNRLVCDQSNEHYLAVLWFVNTCLFWKTFRSLGRSNERSQHGL